MTIIVGLGTPEGLVLAGDSRSTYEWNGHHRIASDYAQKIFTIGAMGVATFGWAFLGSETIAGAMDQFAAQVGEDGRNVHDFAKALGRFFAERFDAVCKDKDLTWDPESDGWPLGFLVAGYDEDGVGHIKGVLIPGGEVDDELSANTTAGGMMWRGQTDVIGRLLKGVDWQALFATQPTLPEEVEEELQKLEYVPLAPITIQDGVDYAAFLVRTTIDMQRFSDGIKGDPGAIPGCGGPIQLLAIERSGPRWVSNLLTTLSGPSQPGLAEGAELSRVN
jgi:hypothetical protein